MCNVSIRKPKNATTVYIEDLIDRKAHYILE